MTTRSKVFLAEIRNAVADHISQNIQFTPSSESNNVDEKLAVWFPQSEVFPQNKEVVLNEQGLYTKVSIDSDVERRFVINRIHQDPNVICFFKFPHKFKIDFPLFIGNYNPDWGIIRENTDGSLQFLVRETKGSDEIKALRFPHEKRKIICAAKHFEALGIDFRFLSDNVEDYWTPGKSSEELQQELWPTSRIIL